MNISVFAKKRTSKDGRGFLVYIGRIKRKSSGEEITTAIKFKDCDAPEKTPCNIVVNKDDANLSEKKYLSNQTGEYEVSYTLWVSKYEMGEEFVDHSLDDFE